MTLSAVYARRGATTAVTAAFAGLGPAVLAIVSQAVVGVIANLSVYFSIHTLFSHARTYDRSPLHLVVPVWATISTPALFVTGLAFVLVFRARFSVLRVLGICAVVGAALYLAAH